MIKGGPIKLYQSVFFFNTEASIKVSYKRHNFLKGILPLEQDKHICLNQLQMHAP